MLPSVWNPTPFPILPADAYQHQCQTAINFHLKYSLYCCHLCSTRIWNHCCPRFHNHGSQVNTDLQFKTDCSISGKKAYGLSQDVDWSDPAVRGCHTRYSLLTNKPMNPHHETSPHTKPPSPSNMWLPSSIGYSDPHPTGLLQLMRSIPYSLTRPSINHSVPLPKSTRASLNHIVRS